MDGPCHEFLAGAALAGDEHGGLEVGDLGDGPEDLDHLRALGEDRLELVLLPDLLAERAVLAAQGLALLGLLEGEDHLVLFEGLAHVVVRAGLHRLERQVHVAVRAHHDDRRRVLLGLEGRQEVEAAHLGHTDVREDYVGAEGVDQRERRLAAVGHLDVVPVFLQEGAENEPDVLLVIDYEHAPHGYPQLLRIECTARARAHAGIRVRRRAPQLAGSARGARASHENAMKTGILDSKTSARFAGAPRRRRVGLLAHPASVDRRLVHARHVLDELDLRGQDRHPLRPRARLRRRGAGHDRRRRRARRPRHAHPQPLRPDLRRPVSQARGPRAHRPARHRPAGRRSAVLHVRLDRGAGAARVRGKRQLSRRCSSSTGRTPSEADPASLEERRRARELCSFVGLEPVPVRGHGAHSRRDRGVAGRGRARTEGAAAGRRGRGHRPRRARAACGTAPS